MPMNIQWKSCRQIDLSYNSGSRGTWKSMLRRSKMGSEFQAWRGCKSRSFQRQACYGESRNGGVELPRAKGTTQLSEADKQWPYASTTDHGNIARPYDWSYRKAWNDTRWVLFFFFYLFMPRIIEYHVYSQPIFRMWGSWFGTSLTHARTLVFTLLPFPRMMQKHQDN